MAHYATSLQHVLAELERVDLLLRLCVERARAARKGDDPFQGLYITDDEIDARAAEPAGLPRWTRAREPDLDRVLADLSTTIADRREASAALGVRLRLVELERLFALTSLDVDVLLLGLAPEIDLRYERFFAYLQDDVSKRRPSVDLALNLLSPSFEYKLAARASFAASAPLVHHRLIELFEDPSRPKAPLLGMSFRADERIVRFLFDSDAIEPPLRGLARVISRGAELDAAAELDVAAELASSAALLDVAAAELASSGALLVHLQGPRGSGKKTWAEALSAKVGLALLVVDGERLLASKDIAFDVAVRLAAREARLQGAALYWHGLDALLADEHRHLRDVLLGELAAFRGLAFLAGASPWEPATSADRPPFMRVTLPRPSHAERVRTWERALGIHVSPDVTSIIPTLAAKFRMTPGDILASAASARDRARARGSGSALTAADLHAGCRAQSNRKLGELARKIEPVYAWSDLVLPEDSTRQLREICDRVRHRGRVLEEWEFEKKLSLGKGLSALFAGPSGTGKTMAAEIIARDLGLDLYKIDLSSVISKYIGETEKNLSRVFAEAETSDAILFFDEADALFGRRSEVKDAHDRYANVETSYLLQRMEEYEGISILATNLRRNMDDAFVRRMAFSITFPFPEEPERLRIWQGVWPSAVPRSDLDLPFMARELKLAGGNIKNIAVAAAFLAAAEDKPVTMSQLVRATVREMQKMGRAPAPEELGPYAVFVNG